MLFDSDPAATAPFGSVDNPLTSPREPERSSVWKPMLKFSALLVVAAVVFIGLPSLLSGGADIDAFEGTAFATVDGESVVLVPYSRVGRVEPWSDVFQLRMAAVAVESGETVWDEQLSDDLSRESRVLVAGEKYAYLVSGKGLMIVAVADGELVAEGSDIAGLRDRHLAAWQAYAFDPAAGSIVALDRDGGINAIALDERAARPAPKPLADAWRGTLTDHPFAPTAMTNEDEALVAPDKAARLGSPQGRQYTGVSKAASLRIDTLAGQYRPLNDQVFHDASILIDETVVIGDLPGGIRPARDWGRRTANSIDDGTGTVAGLAADLILVRHKTSDDDPGYTVTVLSLKTGEVLDTVASQGRVGAAVCAPDGTVVFPSQSGDTFPQYDRITVVDPTGKARVIEIGDGGPFGGL